MAEFIVQLMFVFVFRRTICSVDQLDVGYKCFPRVQYHFLICMSVFDMSLSHTFSRFVQIH